MRPDRLRRIAADPIARIRRLKGLQTPITESVHEAATRIFKSKDGLILLSWLIAQSYGKSLPEAAPDSALRANETRKRFVDAILRLSEDHHDLAGPELDIERRGDSPAS